MKLSQLCTLCAIVTGCASTGISNTVETEIARVLISPQQENQLGLQLKQDMESKQHVRYLDDPIVVGYVRGVADKVITFGKRERPEVSWQVNVIDDPKTVNAFATPGGYLYVYSGLLLSADNEAELAGVMAHECGHVVARHSARQMVDQYGLDAITSILVGKNPGLLESLGTSVATKGFMLANSRSDEAQADQYGARYASLAGYDPHGLITFFGKLQRQEGNTPRVLAYLSDHPATGDRIQAVGAYIAQNHLGGTATNAAQFLAMRARVQAHAPAAPAATGVQGPAN